MTAACAGHPEPLWDALVDGENAIDQARRHTAALAFCRSCPVRAECFAAVDLRHDDGVRGGALLPTISDSDRRSWMTWRPGRSGLGALAAPCASARKRAA